MKIDDKSYLIPIAPDLPHQLGRHVHHDPRNADYRALVAPPQKSPSPNKAWASTVVFDQGKTSSCTAQAATGMLFTSPFSYTFTERKQYDDEAEREALYEASKEYDPYPGVNYEGSSTDAPFKLLRERGSISAWKWLFGEDEVRQWLTWYGPCVVGTQWHADMFTPDHGEYLHPTGAVVGGHAYRLVQFSKVRDAYRIVNSWSRRWGQNGRAWIRADDMQTLLSADGDAVTLG